MVTLYGGAQIAAGFGLVPTWPLLFAGALAMLVLSEVLLGIGQALFRREKLLGHR
jgi:hypothetical protein